MSKYEEDTRITDVQPPSRGEAGKNDSLVVIYSQEGKLLGKRFVLEQGPVRMGRGADNQIVLEGDSVSRRHAHLELRGDAWAVVDDGSTNGTYVNDKLIEKPVEMAYNDRIQIGPTILKYITGADAEAKYHEEIYKMTIVDGLTQIHNKRYLSEALDREMLRARRHSRELSVVMFDIDHFKVVNDDYGHLAGDFVLRELARLVSTRIRRDEVFARYGGEEFVIVLPETLLEGALKLAEDIRKRVAAHVFIFQGETIPVTISLGCALLDEADATSSDLIQRVDHRLYEAKRGGRDRVCS